MNLYDLIIALLIFFGALIILLSAKYTRKIFNLLTESKSISSWKKLRLLMIVFFIGYLAMTVVVLLGNAELLALFSGVIFFAGALFVFMVVSTGLDSFKRLHELHQNLDNQELKNEELEEFAHVISHDLKAPLRGISSLATFIKEDVESGNVQDIEEHFTFLQERVQHLEDLINGILEYSKIGKLKYDPINLNELIGDEFTMYKKLGNVSYTFNTRLPIIYGDRIQIHQVFSNLISNAVKYNDKELCEVHISCVELPMHYEITFEDNGPGIDPKFQHKIFDIFQTLGQTSTESTGVGLSIVKKIIEKHEGKIVVKSDGNLGTKFLITYPKINKPQHNKTAVNS